MSGPENSGMGRPAAPLIEPLGRHVLTEGFVEGKSLLWPGGSVWTLDNASELVDVYVDKPHTSDDSFDVKLRQQLSDASVGARVLFADLQLLNLLPLGDYGPVRKRELIEL